MTYDYVIGMDVGKYFHHACVLDIDGTQVLSKRINQNEKSLHALFSTFSANDHKVLGVVDQPNNIGRLTVAVAQDIGIDVRYLPGLAMRQLSRIHAGNAKTDIRDAYIIAHAAKNLPESLRSVDRIEETFLQLKVLNGIDEDLARSYTRLINQIRSALVDCYPQFEQALRGQIIHRKWVLHLLARYGGPTKIKRLGKAKAAAFAQHYKARNPEPVIDAIFAAISEQTVTIAGAQYAEMGVAMSAKDALLKLEHRKQIEQEVIELINDTPHSNPAIHARNRAKDGSPNPHDHWRHVRLSDSWAPSLLRWLITPNKSVRNLNHVELTE